MNKLYFTSDTHFGHKNILHYTPKRCADIGVVCQNIDGKYVYTDTFTNMEISEEDAIKRMDCFIIDKWNSIIDKHDTVYILGDFSFYGVEDTQRIFHKLNGKKHLVIGNHDGSGTSIQGWTTCKQMNLIDCKKSRFDFLNDTQRLFLCHFPMVSWWSMEHGSIMLHGHCHGRIDDVNESSPALRLDVGWDGRKNIWSLEEIIEYFNDKKIKFDNNNEIVHWRDGDGWHYNIKNDNINQIIEDLLARQNYK